VGEEGVNPALRETLLGLVPRRGVEPLRLAAHAPEACLSANSSIGARMLPISFRSSGLTVSKTNFVCQLTVEQFRHSPKYFLRDYNLPSSVE